MTRRPAFVALAAAATLALVGCPPPDDSGIMCTEEARASVQVSVSGADGAPEPAAVLVEFSQDGEIFEACEAIDDQFVCGYEVAGELVIRASAEGFAPAEQVVEVEMTDDGCHVETQMIELVLEPEAETAD